MAVSWSHGRMMQQASIRAQVSWALYDWANSPFTTLVVTFVFPAYFAQAIVGDQVQGQALWAWAIGLSGAIIAVGSPVLGAVADVAGRRKPWLLGFTLLCVAGSLALWGAEPRTSAVAWALGWVVVANLGFEFAAVFYNAMLPDVAGEGRIGRMSGWSWGLGYAGGLAALGVALLAFIGPERPAFGLDRQAAEHVRVVGPLCGVWLALFSVPLFLWTPDRAARGPVEPGAARRALGSLAGALRRVARMGALGRFLLAHMLYADGLVTLFAMGGIYAAGVYGLTLREVLAFGVLLNVTAGLGAAAFGWVDDRMGSRTTILVALAGLTLAATGLLLTEGRTWLWSLGALLGVFVGPAQAASRSMIAHLAPAGQRTEFFGLYALAGKATAFVGPTLVGLVTAATGSQRAGMTVVLALFVGGMALLATVPATASEQA